jgi:hypothetical protein
MLARRTSSDSDLAICVFPANPESVFRLQADHGPVRARLCWPGLNSTDLAHNPEVAGSNPAPATK